MWMFFSRRVVARCKRRVFLEHKKAYFKKKICSETKKILRDCFSCGLLHCAIRVLTRNVACSPLTGEK